MSRVHDCRVLDLPRIGRPEGTLTPVEAETDIPFAIKRVYYLYDIPAGAVRGAHAHQELEQVFVCVMGAVSLTIKDGTEQRSFRLDRGHLAIYVPKLLWRELDEFSSGSVCVVLASRPYDESDYIRDWDAFLAAKGVA
jgi:hypothetical protein